MKLQHSRYENCVPCSNAMAMALQYAKKLDFASVINRDVTWDKKQCNLTPGQLALSVVLSTFIDPFPAP